MVEIMAILATITGSPATLPTRIPGTGVDHTSATTAASAGASARGKRWSIVDEFVSDFDKGRLKDPHALRVALGLTTIPEA